MTLNLAINGKTTLFFSLRFAPNTRTTSLTTLETLIGMTGVTSQHNTCIKFTAFDTNKLVNLFKKIEAFNQSKDCRPSAAYRNKYHNAYV